MKPLTTLEISDSESLSRLPIAAKAVLIEAILFAVTPATSAFAKSASVGSAEFCEPSNWLMRKIAASRACSTAEATKVRKELKSVTGLLFELLFRKAERTSSILLDVTPGIPSAMKSSGVSAGEATVPVVSPMILVTIEAKIDTST